MTAWDHTLFFLERYKKPVTMVPSAALLKLKVSVKHRRAFKDYNFDAKFYGAETTVERL